MPDSIYSILHKESISSRKICPSLALQGRHQEAECYFKKAVEMARQGFGEGDAHVASSLNNLAEFYRIRRQYELAEPLYQQASNVASLLFLAG